MKGLDHLVVCVNDLDQAVDAYVDLGFTLTPRAKHPFGTHNQLIQLDGFFLELLTVAEPEKIPLQQNGQFGFARFNQHYLAKQEGSSMLVMDTADFRADNAKAIKNGLDTYEVFEFSRNAVLPNNDVVEVSFGLNFVTHPHMPYAAFFTCQQFQPQYFWMPEYQQHANKAQQIIETCMVAGNPVEFAEFLSGFTGCSHEQIDGEDIVIQTSRGRLAVLTPSHFEDRYKALAPEMGNGPQLAGFTIGVIGEPADPVTICSSAILFEQLN